jgi:hypothetical protein
MPGLLEVCSGPPAVIAGKGAGYNHLYIAI